MRLVAASWWVFKAAFWLLALASQLPVASALWVSARPVNLAAPFGAFIGDLVHWRKTG
jgi:hypothetical protein